MRQYMRHRYLQQADEVAKVLIFKPKAPSFHTTEFSHISFFPKENFRFLGGPEP